MNPYRVVIDRQALKFLQKLRDRELSHRLSEAIEGLKTAPRPADCQKLSGRDHQYRIRVGSYRIIYEIRDSELVILVLAMGHRREIYR